jgi:hypothetical protein
VQAALGGRGFRGRLTPQCCSLSAFECPELPLPGAFLSVTDSLCSRAVVEGALRAAAIDGAGEATYYSGPGLPTGTAAHFFATKRHVDSSTLRR